MIHQDILQDPSEHTRFAAYLDALEHLADRDEMDVVRQVLADPDQTMAQSAVLRHLDRRAADLCLGPDYDAWVRAMSHVTKGRPFLAQRLREWSLRRAFALGLPWQPEDLLASSNWLQLRTAAGTHTEALEVLAEAGRTKRIRSTAKAGLSRGRQ